MTLVRLTPTAVLIAGVSLHAPVFAQGTAADYARSDGLRARVEGKVIDAADAPAWVPGTDQLVYRKSVSGGFVFMLVDATTLQKHPAFDHDRLAAAFSAARDSATPRAASPARPVTGVTLPFTRFTFVDSARAIEFIAGGNGSVGIADSARWRCGLTTYACREVPREEPAVRGGPRGEGGGLFGERRLPPDRPKISPDGKWEALVRNYNIYVRPNGSREGGAMLGVDGTEGDAYDPQSIVWSPDSRRIAAYRVKPGYRREVHYIQSSPEDQLQPKQASLLYNKPGDVLDVGTPAIFDVDARREIVVDRALFPTAYNVTALEWRGDSRSVTFEYNQRGHHVYRVIEIDAATGATRAIIDERMPTFFEYSAKKYRYDVADGKDIIWMSERDGWNHLYLFDGKTGRVKNQITKGPWVVRGVDWVDTTARQIWFTASGMYAGKDPYFVHAYRINFDGTGLTTLTDGDANHSITYSPDHRYFADLSSRVDLPPRLQLRRASDGKVLNDVERADASALLATGWQPPEVFVTKGRDGTTDIWGVVIRPTNFDSTKKYPVIENIYAGPQGSFVPKTFSTQLGMQSIAELGFIVVQIDGMGTSNRSKAFHDVAWKNLGDAGFPDRILWHRAFASKHAFYDTSRVGIYGTSAGGQNSMGALLFHPEFYKAAVSAAGCHDNRMDKIWWNEQWMGELGPHYAASSNVDNAYRLQGHLLLVVGEMDMNVDPSSTFQVVNSLIKANKMFDLLVIPGAGHTSGGPYGDKKRNDFFVYHLMGVEPPDRNLSRIATASGGDK